QAIIANTANNLAPSDASLYADDRTRGYRLDVLEMDTNTWRSLCRRHVKYTLPGVTSFEVDDEEGYVKGSAATSTGGAPTDDLYVHESMFGWSGWSLVAQRPGQTLSFVTEPGTNKQHTMAVPRQPNRPSTELIMNGTVPFDVQTEVHAQP